jgi:hypothetical protein
MRAPKSLRCDEVTSELSAPSPGAGTDGPDVAAHLAACPDCASWAERGRALDRLWDATRPAEPSDETWDAVWSDVNAKLDGTAVVRAPRPGYWRRRAVTMALVAQAAAVVAAVTLWANRRPAEEPAETGAGSQLAQSRDVTPTPGPMLTTVAFEIEPGETGVIREDVKGFHLVELAQDERSGSRVRRATWANTNTSDANYEMHNYFEAIARVE